MYKESILKGDWVQIGNSGLGKMTHRRKEEYANKSRELFVGRQEIDGGAWLWGQMHILWTNII